MAEKFSAVKSDGALTTIFFPGMVQGMKTAAEIIDFISQDAVCAELQITPDAVRKAVVKGELPSSWYNALERLAGRPLPRDVFSFKGVS